MGAIVGGRGMQGLGWRGRGGLSGIQSPLPGISSPLSGIPSH